MAATVGEARIYWCRFEEVIAGDNAAKHLFVAIMWNTLNCFLRDRTSSTAICSQWNIYQWQGFEKKGPSACKSSLAVICSLSLVTSHFIRLLEASSIQTREIFKRAIYFLIYLLIFLWLNTLEWFDAWRNPKLQYLFCFLKPHIYISIRTNSCGKGGKSILMFR